MNTPVNNQTRLYVSVASHPGNFGATIFNALFAHYKVNAVYVPRTAPSASALIEALRALDIAGCSVSMPLKSAVIPFLDEVSPEALSIGSVNTIVSHRGRFIGHNTDCYGCREVLVKQEVTSLLIFGSGSVVNSVVFSAREAGINDIHLTGRNIEKVRAKARELEVNFFQIGDIQKSSRPLLINATPSGDEDGDLIRLLLAQCSGLFDLRVRTELSPLEKDARGRGLWTIPGVEMAKFQLQKQMELYTGIFPPSELLESFILEGFSKKNPQ